MSTLSSSQLAGTMHRALEQCNVEMILGCYDDDAEIRVIDQTNPPSAPLVLRGKKAISGYYKDLCSRDMKHSVQQEIVGDNQFSLAEACRYSDGTRVFSAEMYEMSDGRISRQVNVQAWDES